MTQSPLAAESMVHIILLGLRLLWQEGTSDGGSINCSISRCQQLV
jgi:hypothetical protein